MSAHPPQDPRNLPAPGEGSAPVGIRGDRPGADDFAYEVGGVRVPRERFYAVACDPRRSVAVEACAGAGKTWMLVSRILRALLEGVPPHEILAITFTKKAAGEMRARLQEWLREFSAAGAANGQVLDDAGLREQLRLRGLPEARAGELAPALRGLYAQLLAGGRPVQIRTFHSWFAALLRTAPVVTLEALGLPARGELLEDDAEAIARVWRPFHDRVAQDPQARRDFEASVAAHGRSQTRKALESALSKRVEFDLADAQGVVDASVQRWGPMFPDLAGDTAGITAGAGGGGGEGGIEGQGEGQGEGLAGEDAGPSALLAGKTSVAGLLWAAAADLGRASQKTCVEAASRLERALTAGDLPGVLQALLTDKHAPRKFGDKVAGIDGIRAAQALALRLRAAEGQHQAWLHQGRMARLARRLLEDYARLKRAQGWIDMSDVERSALALLSDPVLSGWVQERLDARVSQLLIDEFQDTNPLQWQALHAWLSGYVGAGSGDAPSVFIVGDPKQSIYRFRRAEPQVFRAAQRFVVAGLGGTLLGCDHTRRNAPAVLQAVNAALGAAQEAGAYEGYRAHTTESAEAGQVLALPAIARPGQGDEAQAGDVQGEDVQGSEGPGASASPEPRWRDSLTEPREQPEERLIALECRQAADWLAERIAGGLAPGEVMVLARRRARLVAMEEALRARGIPAQQPDKSELGEAPEVQDLVALVDVLVSPTHDLSLARVLKSPVFGATDADLATLALRARVDRSERAAHGVHGERGEELPRETSGPAVSGVQKPAACWFDLLQATLPEGEPVPAEGLSALAEAATRLARWKRWVDTWPPHDALDAIYQDGDVLARYAAATPAAIRPGVLANLRALLQAALEVAGGRYLTPYAFVRALRVGGQRAPAVAAQGAVQLLTVHGAKGLESRLVLMLDTDGAAPRAETMGVLVDWPGEAATPLRFVFLASESRPPACCETLLAQEREARAREELNAMYVAMTRAREALVLSSVAPYKPAEGSWWRRLEGLCEADPGALPSDAAAMSVPPGGAEVIELSVVPSLPAADAPAAPVAVGDEGAPDAAESLRARFGEALHRLLEGVPLGAVPLPGTGWPPGLLQRVAREFRLTASALAEAVAMADRILGGEGAWAWDPARVEWADNEVPLHLGGELLRIDRLVRLRGENTWWVLDYKSAARPEADDSLRAQLARYREAVSVARPGAQVLSGFLTGAGRLVRSSE